jgi:Domain of unknown function (DUF4190)
MSTYQPGQPFQGAPRNHPSAVPALVCGILSLVICGVFTGIPAVVMGNRAIRGIDASNGSLDGRGMAKAGVICGWVSVAWTVLTIVLVIGLVAGSSGS